MSDGLVGLDGGGGMYRARFFYGARYEVGVGMGGWL